MWKSENDRLLSLEREVLELRKNVNDINANYSRKPDQDQSQIVSYIQKRYKMLNEKLNGEMESGSADEMHRKIDLELKDLRSGINKALKAQARIFVGLKEELDGLKKELKELDYEIFCDEAVVHHGFGILN